MILKIPTKEPYLAENTRDRFLIDMAIEKGLEEQSLESFSHCRLYLQVLTLSDILTGDGKYLQNAIYQGEKETQYTPCKGWPNQGKPPTKDWKTQLKSLLQIQSENHAVPAHVRVNRNYTPEEWIWFYNKHEDRLYRKTYEGQDHQYEVYSKIPHPRRRGRYQSHHRNSMHIPLHSFPLHYR